MALTKNHFPPPKTFFFPRLRRTQKDSNDFSIDADAHLLSPSTNRSRFSSPNLAVEESGGRVFEIAPDNDLLATPYSSSRRRSINATENAVPAHPSTPVMNAVDHVTAWVNNQNIIPSSFADAHRDGHASVARRVVHEAEIDNARREIKELKAEVEKGRLETSEAQRQLSDAQEKTKQLEVNSHTKNQKEMTGQGNR